MTYCMSSGCYAARAWTELDSNEAHRLFYAALEIRCGIEARMREYLELAPRRGKQRGQWKIAKMGRELDRVFHGDRPARLTFHAPGLASPLILIYSPVDRDLRKAASRLGDYLHAMKTEPSEDDLDRLRRLLEAAYSKLLLATSGNLMGPPLMNSKTREVHTTAVVPDDLHEAVRKTFAPGATFNVEVRYLENLTLNEVHEALGRHDSLGKDTV